MATYKPADIPENPESELFVNIAESLSDAELSNLAEEVLEGIENDNGSLFTLEQTRNEYNSLYNMQYKKKDSPWQGAANVLLPTITAACTNFWARAGINLFPADNKIINVLPVDNTNDSMQRAKRVKTHMNWQLMTMPDFFDGFGKTLIMNARDGYAFRKTYWDSNLNKVMSVPVLPQNFIVNYYTKSLTDSMRYTQVLEMSVNEIKLKAKQGIFIDCPDITEGSTSEVEIDSTTEQNKHAAGQDQPADVDYTTPRLVYECHTYLFIGDDEIRRPFIVTIDKDSRKILRIIDRTNPDPDADQPLNYFTNYTFISNPDSIFGYGFGSLLLGITSTMNTSINQMLDAATANNMKGGWVLKGSQMNRGDQHFSMGQFKQVSVRSDDIRKAILPLEFSPPSQVLLNLLSFMQGQVDRLTTVTEIFSGGMPRSDTTATSSTIAQEEGAKVFTMIQKGIHRSFKDELKKMYDLNSIFLDQTEYINVISGDNIETMLISIDDYKAPLDIVPVSDPSIISQGEIAQKAEYLASVVERNPFLAQDADAQKLVMQRRLEANMINQADIDALSQIMDIQQQTQEQQQLQQLQNKEQQLIEQQQGLEQQLNQ